MKKLLVAALMLNAVFLAARFFQGIPANAAPGAGGTAIENGDCDGNGTREITDAVSLLGWLFLGGQAPVPIDAGDSHAAPSPPEEIHCAQTDTGIVLSWENPAPYDSIEIIKNGAKLAVLTARENAYEDPQFREGEVIEYTVRGKIDNVVSARASCSVAIPPPPVLGQCLVSSHQKTCYGAAGSPVDCSVPPALGQDGYYDVGCPAEGRFVDHGDGTVTDRCTGLMWTKQNLDVNGDFELTDVDQKSWRDAIAYVEGLTFAGHDDWKLPDVEELFSLVDFGADREFWRLHAPLVTPDRLWSSTTLVVLGSGVHKAWSVGGGFDGCSTPCTALVWASDKANRNFIMAVRTAR